MFANLKLVSVSPEVVFAVKCGDKTLIEALNAFLEEGYKLGLVQAAIEDLPRSVFNLDGDSIKKVVTVYRNKQIDFSFEVLSSADVMDAPPEAQSDVQMLRETAAVGAEVFLTIRPGFLKISEQQLTQRFNRHFAILSPEGIQRFLIVSREKIESSFL